MTTERRRVGLYGGTFDPVHKAHLQLASSALTDLHLDRVIFLPAASPPHKQELQITAFKHRFAMLELACRTEDNFTCSVVEANLPVPSYTIDTLHYFHHHLSAEIDLFFLMGSDALLDIINWKSYKEILSCVSLLVCNREGDDLEEIAAMMNQLAYENQGSHWSSRNKDRDIIFLDAKPDDISSTEIRNQLTMRKSSVEKLLPPGVYSYIRKFRLYQKS